MDYENKYKEALERVRVILTDRDIALHAKEKFIDIFPELKESEDERIRKELIAHCRNTRCVTEEGAEQVKNWIAWLEKQGEQKPTDKTELKFNIGDWIVGNEGIFKITRYEEEYGYELTGTTGYVAHFISPDYVESNFHLWDITDARDGDVLMCNINKAEIGGDIEKLPNITPTIFIYQNVVKDKDFIHSYCSLYDSKSLVLSNTMYYNTFVYNIHPATKEQRELLFSKMKQEGCKWDDENKKLSKQPLKITPKFCIGQLITDNYGTWYKILNIECLGDWYYKVYDIAEDKTHLELCSDVDKRFRENRFVDEIKKMMGN